MAVVYPLLLFLDIRSMNIEELINRFEFYAQNHPAIKHDPSVRFGVAFLHLDIEDLQEKLTDGVKFPSLLIQTPGVEKDGDYDNKHENYGFTFVVLNSDRRKSKAQLIGEAKAIADTIYKRLNVDIQDAEVNYGVLDGTDEGMFGPINGEVYGWAVSLNIEAPFDAELKAADWLDLQEEAI